MSRLISRKYSFRKLNIILLSVVIVFTLFISIGYSAINSNLLISGDLAAEYNEFSLYEQVRRDAYSNKFAKKYEGDTSTFTGDKGIYYYYGEATNNNVKFANFCWKIVRTTDTGGVKLLYNGIPAADGSCNNMGDASALTKEQMGTDSEKVAFNSNRSSLADVGYMFNKRYEYNYITDFNQLNNLTQYGNSFTWDGENYTLTDTVDNVGLPSEINTHHYTCFNAIGMCSELKYVYYVGDNVICYIILSDGKSIEDALNEMLYNDDVNKYNSNIKNAIDYWYQKNMTDFTDYLEDTIWCNDRSINNLGGWNSNGGNTTEYIYFKSANDKVNLTCERRNDRFTVVRENGNGNLIYPVGLLDATEVILAYDASSSPNSPLASGDYYWGLSPNYVDQYYAYNYHVNKFGSSYLNYVTDSYFVRPAISLKADIRYSSGDGSSQQPYVIEIPKPKLYERIKSDSNNPTKNINKYEGDTSTFQGDKEVYYYYGDTQENNVVFANYCWKIIRTTDTGGVKLLYNGMPTEDGICDNMDEGSALTAEQMNTSSSRIPFNSNSSSIADVGYMHNTRYEEFPTDENVLNEMLFNDNVNTNDSTIKAAIDYWYANNMTKYTEFLEDAVWCNDRSITEIDNDIEMLTFVPEDTTNLACKNKNDRFTVNSKNGNGALTYPVGLIDLAEINLAYNDYYSPHSSKGLYWSLSPIGYLDYIAYGHNVGLDGEVNHYSVDTELGVRPTVSLKSGIQYSSGDGTPISPFVILTG